MAKNSTTRRNRYINAIEPFRKRFNCTAAQVFDRVNGIVSEHDKLMKDLADVSAERDKLTAEVAELKAKIETLETSQ